MLHFTHMVSDLCVISIMCELSAILEAMQIFLFICKLLLIQLYCQQFCPVYGIQCIRLALQRSALSVLALLSTLFAMIALLHTHTHTHMQSLTRTHTLLHWRAEKSFCSHTEWVRGDWERKNEREGERQRETENCRRVRSPSGQELFSVHTYVRMQVSVCVCGCAETIALCLSYLLSFYIASALPLPLPLPPLPSPWQWGCSALCR